MFDKWKKALARLLLVSVASFNLLLVFQCCLLPERKKPQTWQETLYSSDCQQGNYLLLLKTKSIQRGCLNIFEQGDSQNLASCSFAIDLIRHPGVLYVLHFENYWLEVTRDYTPSPGNIWRLGDDSGHPYLPSSIPFTCQYCRWTRLLLIYSRMILLLHGCHLFAGITASCYTCGFPADSCYS